MSSQKYFLLKIVTKAKVSKLHNRTAVTERKRNHLYENHILETFFLNHDCLQGKHPDYSFSFHFSGKVCEPNFFPEVNSVAAMNKYIRSSGQLSNRTKCTDASIHEDVVYPAFHKDTLKCILQSQPILFSCIGRSPNYRRMCPCRDFIPGQTALSKECL